MKHVMIATPIIMTDEVSVLMNNIRYIGSNCAIETGWLCENGTTSSADTCVEV